MNFKQNDSFLGSQVESFEQNNRDIKSHNTVFLNAHSRNYLTLIHTTVGTFSHPFRAVGFSKTKSLQRDEKDV